MEQTESFDEGKNREKGKREKDPYHRVAVLGLVLSVVITTRQTWFEYPTGQPGKVEKVLHASYIVLFFCCFVRGHQGE